MDVSRGAPFLSSEMHVEPSWIDHDGHLNMAYYHVLLDRASDEFWVSLGLGPRYIETTRCSTFAAECHIRYLREVHLKDQVRTAIFLIGADEAPAYISSTLSFGWQLGRDVGKHVASR